MKRRNNRKTPFGKKNQTSYLIEVKQFGKTHTHMQIQKSTNINSRRARDLNMKNKTLTLLQKNIGKYINDLKAGEGF